MNSNDSSAYYEIRVKGQLDPAWGEWFEDLTVTPLPQGETQISGWIKDQSALHGILVRIRNLNLALLSVKRVDQNGEPGSEEVDL
jgi:hypothetical protein